MRRRLVLLAAFTALAAACAPQQAAGPGQTVVVFFTEDSARLDAPAQQAITQAAGIARANGSAVVHVQGFAAPDTGSAAFNRSLAQTRAQAVADGLTAAGVAPARIRMESRGGTPYADVPRESRRVDIVIGG